MGMLSGKLDEVLGEVESTMQACTDSFDSVKAKITSFDEGLLAKFGEVRSKIDGIKGDMNGHIDGINGDLDSIL